MNIKKQISLLLDKKDRRIMSTELHTNFIIEKTSNIKKYVECGTAKGGICALVALNNPNCEIFALDAWKGMPSLSDKDEKYLQKYVGETKLYGNENIVLDSFNKIKSSTKNLKIIKGWVEDTIPKNIDILDQIDVLRIDLDWYEPILFAIENLYFNIKKGGIIIIDDGAYKGCRAAINHFREKNNIKNEIYRGEKNGCNYNAQFWWIV